MSVECYTEEYKNFGRCVFLDNGTVRLAASIEFGPRILYFGLHGEGNLLFEDIDRVFTEPDGDFGTWKAYGGHRLWCAPESKPETYYPDNSEITYTFENNTLSMSQKNTPFGKQYAIICEMDENSSAVKITNKITNCGNKASHFAPWSVTGLAPGGTEIVPLSRKDTGFLPNREIVLWSYTDIYDPRFTLKNGYALLSHDGMNENAFKAGFNVDDGFIAYILGKQLFINEFNAYEKISYPDFSCNFETYTNKHFLECELLGEERDYLPSETAIISETWRIVTPDYEFDETDIDSYIKKNIKTYLTKEE